jgi:uncharacterized OB-fold protein
MSLTGLHQQCEDRLPVVDSTHTLPPLPVADELTRPFWEAARKGQLVIQRCQESGRWFHPPRPLCTCCVSSDLAFEPVSGRGTVYTFVVMRDRRVRGFQDRVPYVNVWVELEEQPFLTVVANLVDAEPKEARIGMPVEVTFERLTEDVALPQFRPRR